MEKTTQMEMPKTLKNGARIISIRRKGTHFIVLADKSKTSMMAHPDDLPFVTWACDGAGYCYWGHYFKTENEANEDFLKR